MDALIGIFNPRNLCEGVIPTVLLCTTRPRDTTYKHRKLYYSDIIHSKELICARNITMLHIYAVAVIVQIYTVNFSALFTELL